MRATVKFSPQATDVTGLRTNTATSLKKKKKQLHAGGGFVHLVRERG